MTLIDIYSTVRRYIGRYHWHGEGAVGDFLSLHRSVLHALRWIILGRLHRRHSAVLHFRRTVDVHSICVGQSKGEISVRHGGRLDRRDRREEVLVLHRLRASARFRRYPMAGLSASNQFSRALIIYRTQSSCLLGVFPARVVKQNSWKGSSIIVRRSFRLFVDGHPTSSHRSHRQGNS